MNRSIITKTLIAIALTAAVAAPVAAGQSRQAAPDVPAAAQMKLIRSGDNAPRAYPNGNKAKAWTAACYAEFGPKAKYPDAGMLQTCLDY